MDVPRCRTHLYNIHEIKCQMFLNNFFSLPTIQCPMVDGQTEYEGRVEVFYYGQWGTICDGRLILVREMLSAVNLASQAQSRLISMVAMVKERDLL